MPVGFTCVQHGGFTRLVYLASDGHSVEIMCDHTEGDGQAQFLRFLEIANALNGIARPTGRRDPAPVRDPVGSAAFPPVRKPEVIDLGLFELAAFPCREDAPVRFSRLGFRDLMIPEEHLVRAGATFKWRDRVRVTLERVE